MGKVSSNMSASFKLTNDITIQFTDDQLSYNKIRLNHQNLANELTKRFEEIYSKFQNLDDVIKNVYEDGLRIINEAVEKAIKTLLDRGIYDLNAKTFAEKYYMKYFTWDEDFAKLNDQYMEIVLDSERLDDYRRARRQGRGGFVGGGFGVKGAVEGMALAGAANLALGVAHMTANAFGKLVTTLGNSSKKRAIFGNPHTKEDLFDSIWYNVFVVQDAIQDALVGYHIGNRVILDRERSGNIFINLQNIDDNKLVKKYLSEAISIYPYNENYYLYAIERFGDPNNEIENMAKAFGFSVQNFKRERFNTLLKSVNVDSSTEEKAIDALKILEEKSQYLGLSDGEQILNLRWLVSNYDRKARSVEGIVFQTREEAAVARAELTKIEGILRTSDLSTESGVTKAIITIEQSGFVTLVGERKIEGLRELLIKLDISLRTVEGVEYDTREEADEVRKQFESIKAIMDGGSTSTEESTIALLGLLENGDYKSELIAKYVSDLKGFIKQFDQDARTANGVIYDTREEADEVKKQFESIKIIMESGSTSTEESTIALLELLENGDYKPELIAKHILDLKGLISKFDQDARTANGVIYDTREEARLAENELRQIEPILSDGDLSTESGAKFLLERLERENFKTQAILERVNLVRQVCEKFDKDARTVGIKTYESRGAARIAKIIRFLKPVFVFGILIILPYYIISDNPTYSKMTSLLMTAGLVCLPWALFALIKPRPATFYLVSSRLRAVGIYLLASIILIISGTYGINSSPEIKQVLPANTSSSSNSRTSSAYSNSNSGSSQDAENVQMSSQNIQGVQVSSQLLSITDVQASSVLKSDQNNSYIPSNVNDGDLGTSWVEGVDGDGVGEWISLEFSSPKTIQEIVISNGYRKNESLYMNNNRVAKVQLGFSDGTYVVKNLDDSFDNVEQTIKLDQPVVSNFIKIQIGGIYKGYKYSDTCISEIKAIGLP